MNKISRNILLALTFLMLIANSQLAFAQTATAEPKADKAKTKAKDVYRPNSFRCSNRFRSRWSKRLLP